MLRSPFDRKGNWFQRNQTFKRQKQNTQTGRSWGISKNFVCKSSTWPPPSLQVEKAVEKSPAVKGKELPKWCSLSPAARRTPWSESWFLMHSLTPALHHSLLPFLLSGILASLKAITVPEAAKASSSKTLSTWHFSSLKWACYASSSLLTLLFYGPNLLSVGLAWNSVAPPP